MSRYSYAGEFKNPATNYFVKDVEDHYEVWVRHDREKDGSCPPDRKHTSAPDFEDGDEAQEYIDHLGERFEEDYDDYLEENHHEIARMEAYEDFRNEY